MAEIEISVECKKCGQILDVYVQRGNEIVAEPCQGCVEDAYNEGHDEGYKVGYDKGYDEGMKYEKEE